MNQAEKIRAKTLRKHSNYFKRLYKQVVKKVRRLKITKAKKEAIIKDLQECNNIDIMHYLTVAKFTDIESYSHHLNKWLEIECLAFEYDRLLKYKIGSMGDITEKIRLHHKYLDFKNKVFNISEG
jgi:hypothetical protein